MTMTYLLVDNVASLRSLSLNPPVGCAYSRTYALTRRLIPRATIRDVPATGLYVAPLSLLGPSKLPATAVVKAAPLTQQSLAGGVGLPTQGFTSAGDARDTTRCDTRDTTRCDTRDTTLSRSPREELSGTAALRRKREEE